MILIISSIFYWNDFCVLILYYTCFCYVGGLEAVTYTDVLQCAIMLIGAIVLTVIGKICVFLISLVTFCITEMLLFF